MPKFQSVIPRLQVYFPVSLCWAVWSRRLTKWGHHQLCWPNFLHFAISPK